MDVPTLPARSRGFSLIETLVAALVLSIGLLGIAGLFVSTLQNTRSGLHRSKAVAFASDIAERMRANRHAGAAYVNDVAETGSPADCATTPDSTGGNCTASSLAADDIFQWKRMIRDGGRGLPNGTGSITVNNASSPPTYTIRISWSDGIGAGDTDNIETVTLAVQL